MIRLMFSPATLAGFSVENPLWKQGDQQEVPAVIQGEVRVAWITVVAGEVGCGLILDKF